MGARFLVTDNFLVATKRPRFSVPATDEDQLRENVSVFERYRAQSNIPVPGPASPGEDQLEVLQNTTDTTGCEYCLQTRFITSSPFKPQARGKGLGVLEDTQRLWSMGGPCVPGQKRTTWLPHRRREGGYATLCHQRCSRKVA